MGERPKVNFADHDALDLCGEYYICAKRATERGVHTAGVQKCSARRVEAVKAADLHSRRLRMKCMPI